MPQIRVELASRFDHRRFDQVIAQTIDYVDAHLPSEDCMVTVQTIRGMDGLTKVISCAVSDALVFFMAAYDGQVGHA
ncbi:MAG: hypothetical protein AAFX02_01875 [Pseudomonadota bacterium]